MSGGQIFMEKVNRTKSVLASSLASAEIVGLVTV